MPSIFPIAWTFRWIFLTALLVPFCIAAAVVLQQPETYIVRSAIGLATTFTQGRMETIDPPDQVAKATAEQFMPIALAEIQGATPLDFRADAVGPSIMLTGSAPLASEDRIKQIQARVLDLILKQQKQHADVARGNFAVTLESAKRRIESYDEQIKMLAERKNEFKARTAEQRKIIGDIQSSLANTLKAISPDNKIQDVITSEAKVREFRERLQNEEEFSRNADFAQTDLGSEMAKIVTQRDEQYLTASQNEFQLNSVHDAQILMQPTRMHSTKGAKQSLLLLASLIGSLIFAIFVVLMLDRFKPSSSQ